MPPMNASGASSEAHLHPQTVRARWVENELLCARIDASLRGVGFVSHVVHIGLNTDIAGFMRVTQAEVHVEVAINLVKQTQLLSAVGGRLTRGIDGGHITRAVL